MTEHVDVVIVGAGISGISAAWHLQDRCPSQDLRDPGTPGEPRRHLGPVQVPGHPLGLRHVHPRLPVQAVDRSAKAIADGPSIMSYLKETVARVRHRQAHPLRPPGASAPTGPTPTTAGPCASSATASRREITCSFLFACSGYYNYDEGYSPEFPGADGLRGHHRPSAALAGGPRLRRQADRRHRQRRHRGDSDSRAGQFGCRPRDHAAALADLHRRAARRRPVRRRRSNKLLPAKPAYVVNRWKSIVFQSRAVPARPALPELHAQDS